MSNHPNRDDTIAEAYATRMLGYREVAEYFGIHKATVGRIACFTMQQYEN